MWYLSSKGFAPLLYGKRQNQNKSFLVHSIRGCFTTSNITKFQPISILLKSLTRARIVTSQRSRTIAKESQQLF